MTTITHAVQYLVGEQSSLIHDLKTRERDAPFGPRHPDWAAYRAAKRRASLLLTARLLLKVGGEATPSREDVDAALAAGRLSHHARAGRASRGLAFAALRSLRKLEHRLERHPERFAPVGAWLAAREARHV